MISLDKQERAFEARHRIDSRAPLAGFLIAGFALLLISFLPPVRGLESLGVASQPLLWECRHEGGIGTEALPIRL